MRGKESDLELRPAVLDDAALVADLETRRSPDDPRDPAMLRFWWSVDLDREKIVRFIAMRDGEAIAFAGAGHLPWETTQTRFGWTRTIVDPRVWSVDRYADVVRTAETWLREEV